MSLIRKSSNERLAALGLIGVQADFIIDAPVRVDHITPGLRGDFTDPHARKVG